MRQPLVQRALMRVVQLLRKVQQVETRKVGLGSSQMLMLEQVLRLPGMSQDELSTELFIDKTTTAKGLKRLVQEGYVRKERDAADRRIWRLHPSVEARRLGPELRRSIGDHGLSLTQGFSQEELAQLLGYLARLEYNLTESAARDLVLR